MAKNKKHVLSIEFDNEEALKQYAVWLCEQGESDYWTWMEYREQEKAGNITAVKFDFHGPMNESKFLADNTIRTVCGRLDEK